MKKIFLSALLIFAFSQIWAQPVNITEAQGWFESAFVKWDPVENADKYNVYYSGEGITEQKIDDQLIRSYGSYFRADVLGLKAGTYTIKVAPVFAQSEGELTEGEAAVSTSITVMPHDRTGFGFANGRVPGAYKADGSPKDGAIILYITEKTKNTVSLEVTGANSNPCVGIQTILEGFKKGNDNRPLILRLVGQVTDPTYLDKGDIVIENKNNASSYITLEGVGDDAVVDGWGIRLKNASNIEIRNLATMNCDSNEGDNVGLQQGNEYVWLHHCDFFYGHAGGDADQAKGDGALDCKGSNYVTISYNHFWDTGKSNLLGMGEEAGYQTYHHNWYDHSDSRHPRVRKHTVHVYNNYYDGISKYGAGATTGSSIFMEANYFRKCKYPMLISMQGSDVWDSSKQANDYKDNPTFSKEDGGIIKACNNFIEGATRFVPYGADGYPNSTVDFDAYVVTDRNETVPATVKSVYGSNTYNNFDTSSSMYSYTPDEPATAKENVMAYSGRVLGGDFQWTFNNEVDDTSYDVNTELKSALINYETTLVSIQGDGNGNGGNNGEGGDIGGGNESDMIHNFTTNGTSSTFFNITGNLTNASLTYNDLTFTKALKIESSTKIIFTTTESATLTLVFTSGFSGEIKLNGKECAASNGVLQMKIETGTYTITKDNSTNLFYMSVVYPITSDIPDITASVTVYPNPVQTGFYVTGIDKAATVAVMDIYGKTLLQQAVYNDDYVNIESLPVGVYIVKLQIDNMIIEKKIVKR